MRRLAPLVRSVAHLHCSARPGSACPMHSGRARKQVARRRLPSSPPPLRFGVSAAPASSSKAAACRLRTRRCAGRTSCTTLACALVMDDGVTLVADAWHPPSGGPWPVLLQRLPYGRAVASTPVLPHPVWFARHGFAVVVQDCRGRGDSGGTFEPFVDEDPTARRRSSGPPALPFCDGRVATYGFSYQGLAQLYAAARRPPALRGVAAMMCCPDPYEGWTYEGGCLRLPFVTFWAPSWPVRSVGARTDPLRRLRAPGRAAALGDDPPPWFVEWLAHPHDDDYWAARRPDLRPSRSRCSRCSATSTTSRRAPPARSRRPTRRRCAGRGRTCRGGPRTAASISGAEAGPASVFDRWCAFFDRASGRGEPIPARRAGDVSLRRAPDGGTPSTWPPPRTGRALDGHESAATPTRRHGDGCLVRGAGRSRSAATCWSSSHSCRIPARRSASRTRQRRRTAATCSATRAAPLTEALDIAGSPVVTVTARCDRPGHDVVVTLVLVAAGRHGPVARQRRRRCRRAAGDRWSGPSTWSTLRPIAWRCPAGTPAAPRRVGRPLPRLRPQPALGRAARARRGREDTVVATITVHGGSASICRSSPRHVDLADAHDQGGACRRHGARGVPVRLRRDGRRRRRSAGADRSALHAEADVARRDRGCSTWA